MEEKIDDKALVSLAALLIHAAKIDESYTSKEEQIINQFITKYTQNESKTAKLLIEAKSFEENLINY